MSESFFEKLSRCYIIAEIGVNHNGDARLALEMIDRAKSAGADAVKFQTFTAENLVSKGTPKVKYQESTTSTSESHYEMIKRLELSREDHKYIFKYCRDVGVDFISTPYDIESAIFLSNLGVKFFKTASADLVDIPLQTYLAKTQRPVMVSVGMATMGEIEKAVNIYRKAGNNDCILLHCVSNYPCSADSLNLFSMKTISRAFCMPVGYSDHSVGSEAAMLSIACGAKVIEKHFTSDKGLPGPDQKASSSPEEFNSLVKCIRKAEIILGSPIKRCQPEEMQMRNVSRKSIVLKKEIFSGETITNDHLCLKRPGTGLSSEHIDWFVGKTSLHDKKVGSLLDFSDFIKN